MFLNLFGALGTFNPTGLFLSCTAALSTNDVQKKSWIALIEAKYKGSRKTTNTGFFEINTS